MLWSYFQLGTWGGGVGACAVPRFEGGLPTYKACALALELSPRASAQRPWADRSETACLGVPSGLLPACWTLFSYLGHGPFFGVLGLEHRAPPCEARSPVSSPPSQTPLLGRVVEICPPHTKQAGRTDCQSLLISGCGNHPQTDLQEKRGALREGGRSRPLWASWHCSGFISRLHACGSLLEVLGRRFLVAGAEPRPVMGEHPTPCPISPLAQASKGCFEEASNSVLGGGSGPTVAKRTSQHS